MHNTTLQPISGPRCGPRRLSLALEVMSEIFPARRVDQLAPFTINLDKTSKKENFPQNGSEVMSDLKKYVSNRKAVDAAFNENYEEGYQAFKIGVLLRQAREASGLTQEQIAEKLNTKKSAISRIENHAEDIKLSTLEKFASVLGCKIEVSITQDS